MHRDSKRPGVGDSGRPRALTLARSRVHVISMQSSGARSSREKEPPAWPTRLAAYGLPIAFVSIAFAATGLLKQRWPSSPSFMFFVPAIALTAWRAGRGATALATTVSLLLIDWFFLPPVGSLKVA